MTNPVANQLRPARPFGRARPARAEQRKAEAAILRERIQRKIWGYEREAMRLALRGERLAAAARLKSAQTLKALRRPAARD